jgi:hypothetical protein
VASQNGRVGFVAYPASPAEIGACIERGITQLSSVESSFGSWRGLQIGGQLIPSKVHEGVRSSSIFVADITVQNFNVAYEIGLAIGSGIPIVLTKFSSFLATEGSEPEKGIFDAIGYDSYSNSSELANLLRSAVSRKPLVSHFALNPSMPVYTLLPKRKNDFALHVQSSLKKAKLSYRVFDASEQTQLTAGEAIKKTAESYALALFLLPENHVDSKVHNIRTMFVAGLAQGLDKPMILLAEGGTNIPMDVQQIAVECKFPEQIKEAVQQLGTSVMESFQTPAYLEGKPLTQLERIDLGASSAENELTKLQAYYLATDAFQRTMRGEARLVVGRKGSGKSAVFYQMSQRLSQDKTKLVVDLKPDGFQLMSLKDNLAPVLAPGALEHVVTAFWEYVLYCEIANQFLKKTASRIKHDAEMLEVYTELDRFFKDNQLRSDGDFSERIVAALRRIEAEIAAIASTDPTHAPVLLTSPQISAIVHKDLLVSIEKILLNCLKKKSGTWVLFDNIDKGWPAHGLSANDILIVRGLQDAARKVSRSLQQKGIECHSVVFLRNDVYELLVSETPDRGKDARVLLDWIDREALKEVVRRRLVFSGFAQDRPLEELWNQICTPYYDGEPSFEFLLDRCLMRPRFLLDLVSYCISTAVNVGHQKVEVEDLEKGVAVFSSGLVSDISYEIADVLGSSVQSADGLLMRFVECDQILSENEVLNLLQSHEGIDSNLAQRVLEILLWHGVMGVSEDTGVGGKYVFDFSYNFALMRASLDKSRRDNKLFYRIHDAFTSGLRLSTM